MDLEFLDWGLIDYEQALQQQLNLVEQVAEKNLPGFLIFCSHPAIITLGRATQPGDVFGWQGKVVEISRGGRATYHGPSQLVIYPILNLTQERKGRAPREIAGYLRVLENSIVETLKDYGISAEGKSLQKKPDSPSETDETGVWVGRQKVASLGIAVKKWVTYHGAALNVEYDPKAFTGMKPCGFTTETMVSMEQLLNQEIDREKLAKILKSRLLLNL
ncbi:MAG: lipoyl(octanoyl) transferase LipB [Bdellovibrionia bacterium]